MANTDAPFGAKPIGTTDGSDYHGKLRQIHFLAGTATAIFVGDFLVQEAGGSDATGKLPSFQRASTGGGSRIAGALVGLDPDFTDEGTLLSTQHRLASTARTGQMVWGSNVLFVMQEDSDGNSITATEAGENANIVFDTAGSTITGISGMEIDSDSAATTASLQLRLHHVHDMPGNALGDQANWVVSINQSSDLQGIAGV